RQHPALQWGRIRFLHSDQALLVFERRHGDDALLVAFNLSAQPASVELPALRGARVLEGHGLPSGRIDGTRLHVPAHGACYASLAVAH
ncbi:MAG: hypothetical protein RL684_1886, partial [Pseudomonadota bacterium]